MDKQRKNAVGAQIKAVRHEKSLTQDELGIHLQRRGVDLDRKAVSKIETGLRGVSDAELYAIADVLEVSTDSLFASRAAMLRYLETLSSGD